MPSAYADCELDHIAAVFRASTPCLRDKYAATGRPATTKAALIARAIQDGLIDVNDL